MKHRIRHSAVLFLSMMLMVALFAGFSPASSAASLRCGVFRGGTVPTIADKASASEVADAAQAAQAAQTGEEVPLKDRLLKDEVQKEAGSEEAAAENAAPEEAEPKEAATENAVPDASEPQDPVLENAIPDEPRVPDVTLEAIRKANDPDALIAKYGGYGFFQTVYADLEEESDYSWYASDGMIYFEYPELVEDWDSWDDDSYGWDGEGWTDDDWYDFDYGWFDDWCGRAYPGSSAAADDDYGWFDDWCSRAYPGSSAVADDDYAWFDDWCGRSDFDTSAVSDFEDSGVQPAAGVLITDRNSYELDRYADGETVFNIAWYAGPDDGAGTSNLQDYPLTLLFDSPLFELTDVRLTDGLLAVTMAESPFAFEEKDGYLRDGHQFGCNLPGANGQLSEEDVLIADTWADGSTRWVYYLDPDTLEVQYYEAQEVLPDGETLLLYSRKVFFSKPESAIYSEIIERAQAYELEVYENPRTVTVIYDPGTELEETVSRTCETGDFLTTYFLDGYGLYADAEGTVPFVGSDASSDLTVYAIREDSWDGASEDGGEIDIEGTFAGGPVAGDDAIPADEPTGAFLIVEPSAEEPGVVVLNPADEDADGFAEAVIVPAEEELDYAEISDRIYEANKLDAIFMNHASVQYSLTFDKDKNPDRLDFIYETPDMAYSETRDAAFYATSDSFYQLWLDDADSELYYTFDFVNGFDPHRNAGYQIVPATSGEWWNPENETPVDAYRSGDVVYVESVYDESMSRSFIQRWLHEDYDGQTVSAVLAADPDSYELLALIYNVTDKDGQAAGSPLIFSVDYDAAEPRACRNMRAIAERSAEKTADLTIVSNPGTDHEVTESMTVPAGSTVIYVTDSDSALYEDAGCTIQAGRWDKTSSMTWYLVTD